MPINDFFETVSLVVLESKFREHGCDFSLIKKLAPNDNTKNQIFLGSDLSEVSGVPTGSLIVNTGTSQKIDSKSKSILHAAVSFNWLTSNGFEKAPHAQIIYYPQYPEVRLSGLLRGTTYAPSVLLNPEKRGRELGRVLILGVNTETKTVFGVLMSANAQSLSMIHAALIPESNGVFSKWQIKPSEQTGSRGDVFHELCRIHELGWIESKRLSKGGIIPYSAPNGGGYTLEAELGILPNGYSLPDYQGWEVKQHKVKKFTNSLTGKITLFTPEPDGGLYVEEGLEYFIKKWGFQKSGNDRFDFVGMHKAGVKSARTGLTLFVNGYEAECKEFDIQGGVELRDDSGLVAARWSFTKLLEHWKKKHANAVYVPSIGYTFEFHGVLTKGYAFNNHVHIGVGTTFDKFLNSLTKGEVCYDPGIHLTPNVESKKRSQFRVAVKDLSALYDKFEFINVCSKS
jgi:hypothetical protein